MTIQMTMTKSFSKILWERKRKNGSTITHTRIGNKAKNIYAGSFTIENNDDEFWDAYYNHVIVNGNKEYLTETQIEHGQILIDLDFRFTPDVKERLVTAEHIKDITIAYMDCIADIYNIFNGAEIQLWVLQKPNVNCLKDKTKDGLHIVIGISATAREQLYLRQKMINMADDIFGDLPLQNNYDDVFDKGLSTKKTNWQMFGSRKPDNEKYEIVEFYDLRFDGDKFDWMEYDVYDFKNILGNISAKNPDTIKFNLKNDVSQLLASQIQNEKIVKKKKEKKKKQLKNNCVKGGEICYEIVKDKFHHICLEVLEDTQKAAGVILKCASTGDKIVLELLHDIMEQASNYDKDWVNDIWNSYDETKHSDYIFTYGYLKETQSCYVGDACNTETELDIARAVIYLKYGDIKYYKDDDRLLIWNGNFWQYEKAKNNCAILCSWIYKHFYDAVCSKQIQALDQQTKTIDDKEREKLSFWVKKLEEMKSKCKKESWQTNIVSMMIKLTKNDFSVNEINLADDFFVFKNKTWSLLNHCWVKPSSIKNLYNTLSSPHKWREPTEKEIETINKIVKQIMMDDETRHSLLTILSTGLSGRCLQKFISLIGTGRNGKGLLNSLFLLLLGKEYGGDPNVAVLCNKQKSGGCPELANLGWVRYARFGEPDEDLNKMNWGVCKGLTGGDPIKARKLHSNKTEYKNSLTTIIERQTSANILISGDGCDNASLERMILIEFLAYFTNDSSKWNGTNCFPQVSNYGTTQFKLNHIFALFKLLADYYKTYSITNNINLSAAMKKTTKNYLKKCDEFMTWFDDTYETESDDKIHTTLFDICEEWLLCDDYRNLSKNMKRSRGKKYIKQKLIDRFKEHNKKNPTGKFHKRKFGKRNVFTGIIAYDMIDDMPVKNNNV